MHFQDTSVHEQQHNNYIIITEGVEGIIVSFLKVIDILKYPSNAYFSYFDNGLGILSVRHLFTSIFCK